MIASRASLLNQSLRRGLALLLSVLTATQLQAAELRLEGKLIWGTNDEKSPDAKHKPVDEVTAAKLRKVFKWKNYFEVNRKTAVIPSRGTGQLVMSQQCVVEITELAGPRVEVKLIGKGKPVNRTTTQGLSKGESFVLAGDDKNDCAWFVIITELEEK